MRRVLVLLLLLVGMQMIVPFGTAGQGSLALLAFGFLILAAYTVGEIASDLNLPKIVGYLIAGVLFGPDALNAVPALSAARLEPVSDLAIALIAFLAGAELRWSEVRERGLALTKVMSAEMLLTFAVILTVIVAFSDLVPFLQGASSTQVLVLALLFTSVAIVHSPAVTMALLQETGARGPVARSTLGIVLLSDIAVVVLFSIVVTIGGVLMPPAQATGAPTMASAGWEIAGAVLVGAVLGGAISLYLRLVQGERILFGILIVFFGAEIARVAHVETLLTLLTAGFVMENTSPHGEGEALRRALARGSAPVFVVFFALSGAKMDIGALVQLLPLLVPLALLRALSIWTGTRLGARWAGLEGPEAKYVWMGLVSQAGMAIGLATIVARLYPEYGDELRTLLLAMIALNELAGPILFRRALALSGEVRPAGAAPPAAPATAAGASRAE